MRTAIYMRVSTEDQSIEMQMREIGLFLESRGVSEYQVYSDEGISALKQNRPGLNALKNAFKQGAIETLVVYKLDRLFRSLTQLLAFLNELKIYNIKLISIRDNIDLTTPAGNLTMQLIGAFAEFERNIISDRTKSGLANARAKGSKLGRPTKIGTDLENKIKELRGQGLTFKAIGDRLALSPAVCHYVIKKTEFVKNN